MFRKLLLIILLLTPLFSIAQKSKIVTVSGSFIYHYPSNISPDQARLKAITQARIDLISNRFGTTIHQHNETTVINRNGESHVDMKSNIMSDIGGKWVGDVGEPVINIDFEQDMIVVYITLSCNIIELTNEQAEYDVVLLRNGTDLKFQSTEFVSGDNLYIHFRSKTDGYLAIYLDDYCGNVILLSQYYGSCDAIPIRGRNDYLLFKSDASDTFNDGINRYQMECSSSVVEYNKIHVIFSPNVFTLVDGEYNGVMVTDGVTFKSWLTKILGRDAQMSHTEIDIVIKPNN